MAQDSSTAARDKVQHEYGEFEELLRALAMQVLVDTQSDGVFLLCMKNDAVLTIPSANGADNLERLIEAIPANLEVVNKGLPAALEQMRQVESERETRR